MFMSACHSALFIHGSMSTLNFTSLRGKDCMGGPRPGRAPPGTSSRDGTSHIVFTD